MQPVRDRADYIINTQNLTLAQLHKKLCRLFTETGEAKLPINVVAFGYKYGIPIDADLVLDVRFLPNPYYIEELKDLSGLDQPVYDFVMQQPDTAEYMRLLTAFIDFQLPRFREEGKPALTVAVGCTGGGTGLSTMLRGLKRISPSITAIVTVMDNGGGSGVLRQELGMLPPGDIRNCLQALANTEPTMEALLAYRFQDGALRGQSFGNLFLAALNGMCDTFDEAVARMSEVLAITGRVLPVTNENVQLLADFDDGVTVTGESQIAEYKKDLTRRIVRAYLSPEHPAALPACLDAIREADLIVLGPGSLYTSVIPNLLVSGIREAIHESDAVKVYVMNLMTQSGETAGYTAVDHVRALFDHGGEGLFDYTLVNDLPIPPEAQEEYLREGAVPITADEEALAALGVTVRYAPVALWQKALVRHDPAALAAALRDLYREASPTRIYG